jgi:hypothetical protein
MTQTITPKRLALRLAIYFTVLIGSVVALALYSPSSIRYLPIGGIDVLEISGITGDSGLEGLLTNPDDGSATQPTTATSATQRGLIALFLALSLLFTLFVMIPITWTYKATCFEIGYRKTFVRVLVVLPLCATTIVLLIQDSLALAFGLAALVAAVRFRIALKDPLDGVYIFASICVGLAAGIGFLGIATVMAIFFCFANTYLWQIDYGRNPLDDARAAKERAKLESGERFNQFD